MSAQPVPCCWRNALKKEEVERCKVDADDRQLKKSAQG
jgi:hypothetical protein